jgi:uncharacterized repeat protein (TIGR04138 family)
MHYSELEEVVRRDSRYAYEAYEFLYAALAHTQKLLGRPASDVPSTEPVQHVSGRQLLEGVRDLALKEFGLMARTVFRVWGVNRTDDFGELVFNLVEAKLMSKTDEDTRADFHDVYDLDQALVHDYRIELQEESERAS